MFCWPVMWLLAPCKTHSKVWTSICLTDCVVTRIPAGFLPIKPIVRMITFDCKCCTQTEFSLPWLFTSSWIFIHEYCWLKPCERKEHPNSLGSGYFYVFVNNKQSVQVLTWEGFEGGGLKCVWRDLKIHSKLAVWPKAIVTDEVNTWLPHLASLCFWHLCAFLKRVYTAQIFHPATRNTMFSLVQTVCWVKTAQLVWMAE